MTSSPGDREGIQNNSKNWFQFWIQFRGRDFFKLANMSKFTVAVSVMTQNIAG